MIRRRPRTDHRHGFLAKPVIMRASQLFAVYRDDLTMSQFLKGTNPTQKVLSQLLGVEQSQDASDRIMRRNPVGQFLPLTQLFLFHLSPGFDIDPRIGTTRNDHAQRIRQHVLGRIGGVRVLEMQSAS